MNDLYVIKDVKAEFRQQDEQDEYHPKASRTLFVGNLDRSTTKELLRDNLSKYGYIIVNTFCITV